MPKKKLRKQALRDRIAHTAYDKQFKQQAQAVQQRKQQQDAKQVK